MPKSVSDIFIAEKNKQANKPIFLYTLYNYDGNGTNLNLAECPEEVVFDSVTYSPFPITFDAIGEQTGGAIDEVKISVGNVSRLIQGYLEMYDFKGLKVRILQVFADIIDHSDSYLEHIFYIDRWEQTDPTTISFYLSSKFNFRDVKIPKRLYGRTNCRWEFKSAECQYSGVETICDRTLQKCRELGNTLNYGGFPSAGGRKIFV